jgi:decaprenylphospho-beta-D-erythro-pentofuranosid-2-ulose 2-reductase
MPERRRNVLIVGATSAIAEAVARRLAARGDSILIAGRDAGHLHAIADDLRVRGAPGVQIATLDVARIDGHPRFVDEAWQTLGPFAVVLIAHGTLPDQKVCEASVAQTVAEMTVNFLGTVSLLTLIANRMLAQGSGTIAVLTSVAGDRGRQSNYVYGAAKGGVTRFLQGLRHRLHAVGVNVIDIKPGFVDTPMTAAIPKGGLLWATPAQVAKDIERALDRGSAEIYTPWFWRWIMLVVRALPNAVFHKTKL